MPVAPETDTTPVSLRGVMLPEALGAKRRTRAVPNGVTSTFVVTLATDVSLTLRKLPFPSMLDVTEFAPGAAIVEPAAAPILLGRLAATRLKFCGVLGTAGD